MTRENRLDASSVDSSRQVEATVQVRKLNMLNDGALGKTGNELRMELYQTCAIFYNLNKW